VAGCGSSDDDTTSGGGGSGGGGEPLTVGSDIPYPPFEQGKAGNYTGCDIELLEAVGKSIDREVEFQDTSFDTIFLDLARGNFDVVASAATITDEREKTVDFTNPYYISEQAILVKEGSEIDSVEKLAGATVGVQQGTTGQEFVEEEGEAGELRKYPQGPDAVSALENGTVDAVVIDIPVAENAVNASEGLETSAAIPTEEEYGFAVAQGETELLEELNEGLKAAIDDGTYAQLYEKWFKREPPKEIETATHEAS
ncbi:MAG TPA: transporter substrate-binding domain-containing protein, partial [Solirubrobacterales bacterium]|nr:transporter substrate-binding domain-containing protein [Solirubrobacterales bacterium]